MQFKKYQNVEKHKYHLVTQSPWPLLTSLSAFNLVLSFVMYMHYFSNAIFYTCICFVIENMIVLSICLYGWFFNIVLESTYEGNHTKKVQLNLTLGMILFILSEVMFFVSFFGSYFYLSYPYPEATVLDKIWPPLGLFLIDPWELPFLNTVILLLSGCYLTISHLELKNNNYKGSVINLVITLMLAVLFTIIQGFEYFHAFFSISDGVFASLFYMLTGFHGFHVIVGTIFLFVCLFRLVLFHFTKTHHLGYEFAIWYWHFVDVVWLFLFFIIYNQKHLFNVIEFYNLL